MQLKHHLQANPGWPVHWQSLPRKRQIAYVAPAMICTLRGTVQVARIAIADVHQGMPFFSHSNIICARNASDFAQGDIAHVSRTRMQYGVCEPDYFVLAAKNKTLSMRFIFHWLRHVVRREVEESLLHDNALPLPYLHKGMIEPDALLQHVFSTTLYLPPHCEQIQMSGRIDTRIRQACRKFKQWAHCPQQKASCMQEIARIEQDVWKKSTAHEAMHSNLLHQYFFSLPSSLATANLPPGALL